MCNLSIKLYRIYVCYTDVMLYDIIQGGSNMTGTDLCVNKPVTVPVIFEPPCILCMVLSPVSRNRGRSWNVLPMETAVCLYMFYLYIEVLVENFKILGMIL